MSESASKSSRRGGGVMGRNSGGGGGRVFQKACPWEFSYTDKPKKTLRGVKPPTLPLGSATAVW